MKTVIEQLEIAMDKIPFNLSISQEKEIRIDFQNIIKAYNKRRLKDAEFLILELERKIEDNKFDDWGKLSKKEASINYLKHLQKTNKNKRLSSALKLLGDTQHEYPEPDIDLPERKSGFPTVLVNDLLNKIPVSNIDNSSGE